AGPVEVDPPGAPPTPAAVEERAGHVDAEPRGAFTRVRAGESLADVARRVYGADDALKTLWLANRDLLDRPDAPVTPGSILRTP
ncbi:MAG: hypothetical protein LC745_01770, partial [Planctomycetia bacterium]|nr:hypothetical protein [Planctomycetia bacterium]